MKKVLSILISLIALVAIVFTLATYKANDCSWKNISGLYKLPEEYASEYYITYVESKSPLTETEEKVLNKFRESQQEDFERMEKPIPVMIQEKSENVILFSDEDGNIYMTGQKDPIGRLT